MAKLTTLEGIRGYTRQPTKYDGMLDCLKLLVACETNAGKRLAGAILYDKLNTIEATSFLNSPSVNADSGPFQQAAQMYVWKVEAGPRAEWVHPSIQDSDFATLD